MSPLIISTINVNGIRAATKWRSDDNLGLLPWLAETPADVVCLQETCADDEQLASALAPALSDGPPRNLGVPPGIWCRRSHISRAAMALRF
jgi:exodeoxyribonuclease III